MFDFFFNSYQNTSTKQIILETIAFVFGILSVWYAKKQNILVYPTGIIATIITSYLLFLAGYLGDMLINVYFALMSFYGWFVWSKSNETVDVLPITRTNFTEKIVGLIMFLVTIIVILIIYTYFDYTLRSDNYIDIFTAGLFFTAMWYMALKKIENWILWIIGDLIVVPLYAYRGLGILALQYLIFTILAILAYIEWKKNLHNSKARL